MFKDLGLYSKNYQSYWACWLLYTQLTAWPPSVQYVYANKSEACATFLCFYDYVNVLVKVVDDCVYLCENRTRKDDLRKKNEDSYLLSPVQSVGFARQSCIIHHRRSLSC